MIKMSQSSQDFLAKKYPEVLKENDLDHFLLKLDGNKTASPKSKR